MATTSNTTLSFAPKVDYATGEGACSVTSADINGDGKVDLVVANSVSNTISVLFNNGYGAFVSKADYAVGNGPSSVIAADINRDGRPDLVVANRNDNTVSVLTNNGNGVFGNKVDYATGSAPCFVASADVNSDGFTDVIATYATGVSIMINNGRGGYITSDAYQGRLSPSHHYSTISFDANGDGRTDLLSGVWGAVDISFGVGDGTFGRQGGGNGLTIVLEVTDLSDPAHPKQPPDRPMMLAGEDINGDGIVDLIAAHPSRSRVEVMTLNGKGNVASFSSASVGSDSIFVATADVTGDGNPDLIVANQTSNTVSVLTNNGDGLFVGKIDFATGLGPQTVISADVNGDGKADLIAANSDSGSVSVLLNNGSGINCIVGTTGSDTLRGTSGNETFSGKGGIDTVAYGGNRSGYTLTKASMGWTVASATDGTDTVLSVERIQFADKSVALDTNGNAGQVYRLYQAALNRIPDSVGLGDWIYAIDNGTSLRDVASGFIASSEFKSLYGNNPTNSDYVTRLYSNVLHRAPEQSGYDYWMNQLASGLQTRNQVLTNFSEGWENQAQVIGVIQNGIEYTQHHA